MAAAIEPRPDWKRYIEHQGTSCPYCGSVDLDRGSFEADAGYAWQSVTCTGCGQEWEDIYRLVDTKLEGNVYGSEETQTGDTGPDDPGEATDSE